MILVERRSAEERMCVILDILRKYVHRGEHCNASERRERED